MLVKLSDKTVRLYFEHTLVPRLDRYLCRTMREDDIADMEKELAGFEKLGLHSKRRSFLERRLRAPQTVAHLEYVAEIAPDGKRTWRELAQAPVRKFVKDKPQSRSDAALHAFHALMRRVPLSDQDKATLAAEYIKNRHKKVTRTELKREVARLRAENEHLRRLVSDGELLAQSLTSGPELTGEPDTFGFPTFGK